MRPPSANTSTPYSLMIHCRGPSTHGRSSMPFGDVLTPRGVSSFSSTTATGFGGSGGS